MNSLVKNSTVYMIILMFSLLACEDKIQSGEKTKPQISIQSFHDAAYNGKIENVREAIEAGIPHDATNENGQNALMLAAYNGHTDIVKLLVGKGMSVNVKDKNGRTALIYASSGPFPKLVQLLINNNAEVNIADSVEHFTALMFAASEGQLENVKILLANGADASLKDIDGDSAVTFARENGHSSVAKYLMNKSN